MTRKNVCKANTQARVSPRSGVAPPVDKQFGQKNGNPQGRGFWKKENTPRYKLEKMMQLTTTELNTIKADENAPTFERKLAACILDGDWKAIESMINQVYGMPKQPVESAGEIKIKGFLPKPVKEEK